MTPLWTDPSPMAVGVWDAREESPAQLADRLKRSLDAIDALNPGGAWVTPAGQPVDPTADLESFVVENVSRDDHGDPFPEDGYSISVSKNGRFGVALTLKAGRGIPGRRTPANRLNAFITGPASHNDIAGTFRAIAEAWSPVSASVRDERAVAASMGRGSWSPFVGQLTWVGDALGPVETTSDEVEVVAADGGTLIIASTELEPEQAIAAALAVLDENGIAALRTAG